MATAAGKKGSNTDDAAIEWQLREQVAATTLILNDLEILGYSGHVSARLPGGETFLIQSFDQSRAALKPDDLLVCDLNGKMLSGPAGQRPPSEVALHCEVLRARPDVQSVAHFHHELTTIFSLVEGVTLTPIKNHAARWADGIPIHPDPSHVATPALGKSVTKTLGDNHALIIRAHGQVVTAESVPAVLIDSVHFVENADVYYKAATLGKVVPLTRPEMDDFLKYFDRDAHIGKLWKYYVGIGREKGMLPKAWSL